MALVDSLESAGSMVQGTDNPGYKKQRGVGADISVAWREVSFMGKGILSKRRKPHGESRDCCVQYRDRHRTDSPHIIFGWGTRETSI